VTFAYDLKYNRLTSMTDGTGTTSYTYYDVGNLGANQVHTVDGPLSNDTVTYTYDALGRVATRSLTGFTNTMNDDALGRLETLVSPVGTFTWTYVGTTGRPATVTYPNGQKTTYSYYGNLGDHRLQQISHDKATAGPALSQFDHAYDAVGNILTWRQQLDAWARAHTYRYDRADQLASAVQRDASSQALLKSYAYAYDPAGNRTVEAIDSALTTSLHNDRNQLTSQVAGGSLPVEGFLNEPGTVTVNASPAEVSGDDTFRGQAAVGRGRRP
jgi:hypothetical protein